jgi:hypothetical protein
MTEASRNQLLYISVYLKKKQPGDSDALPGMGIGSLPNLGFPNPFYNDII